MPSPTDLPPTCEAPKLAASMMPGPPPVITATPSPAILLATRQAAWYMGSDLGVRADPKTATAGPSSASAPKPSTNSAWMRRTRQGSMWSQSVPPSLESRWLAVVVLGTMGPRMMTGPRW